MVWKNQDVVNDAFVQEYKISIWNTLHFRLHIKWQGVTTLEFGNVYCSAYSDPHFRKLECQDLRAPGPYRAPQDAVGDSCMKFLQKCPHLFQNATRSPDRVEYKSTCGPETLAPVHSPLPAPPRRSILTLPLPRQILASHPDAGVPELARSRRPTSPDPGSRRSTSPDPGDDRGHLDGRRPHGSPQWPASPWFTSTTGLPALAWEHRPLW
jgi:hypothetical protein